MKRIAQIMYLKPDQATEYEKRHAQLWPEMQQALNQYGARNYSIFLEHTTGHLFAYLEVKDEAQYQKIADTDICRKWWHYMAPLMKTNTDESPVAVDLQEVFHLEEEHHE
ncbi:L-rhamnose mutarotase [Latilactobacillus sakei]|uniref:L-rhamnose mutarotase n=1 Tax=Latilactobacillus sakei TaxID=1599 RepID=A0AAE8J583_LATSK|nr:L-rhamnose mutarotase [Latilactobacillus sakei]USS39428.1 L-rhamnose mutarotase [Latilactobacillus sakei]SPE18477.1 L-rhamnose mutarotase [Latilactobacillus sakei]